MGVTVHGQKIEVKLCKPAHRCFDCRADIEQFHVQKNAFAVFLNQLVRKRQAAARQHAQTNFIKTHRIAELLGQFKAGNSVGDIKGNDQAVI